MIHIVKLSIGRKAAWVIYGRILGEYAQYFGEELSAFARDNPGEELDLDMAGVSFVDEQGILALREAVAIKIRVTACSPFLHQLLQAEGCGHLLTG